MTGVAKVARVAIVAFAAGAAGAAAVVAGNALRRRLIGTKKPASKLAGEPAEVLVEDAVEIPRR